ncbi:MAG: membrane protein insertase YidC [Candidatus Omnitrophota bacterium]|jgi:YidC/Oxa1 family membrane protein insertase
MEKRLVITIALCILVLLAWSSFVSKTQPVANTNVTTKVIQQPLAVQQLAKETSRPVETSLSQLHQKIVLPDEEIDFLENDAAINKVLFKERKDYTFLLKDSFFIDDQNLQFKTENSGPNFITFVYRDAGKRIRKHFDFSKSKYTIELQIKIENISNIPLKISFPIILGTQDFSSTNKFAQYEGMVVATKEQVKHLTSRKDLNFPDINFLALRDRYFCLIVKPDSERYFGFSKKSNVQTAEIGIVTPDWTIPAGGEIIENFKIYLGPQDLRSISSVNPNWAAVINYGTFDFISQVLLQLLEFIFRILHNWGWTLVVFSLVIYLLLYPLTLKQMRSMKEMQALQPKIEALRQTHKDNPQKLNKEIMELYREHKVNPLGGCLPLLLQMPIFFALYQVLMRSVALRGANFLWIKDLSEPDRLFLLPFTLPVLGNELNILPILMTIGMFIQQKFSMAKAVGEAAEQQKIMLIVMPLMFGLIFYRMPSGLVLYWFINSSLMLLSQIKASRAK